MARPYYLYLTKKAWVDAWVNGGPVPINAASSYLSEVREGTKTPDETMQRTISGMPDWIVGGETGKGLIGVGPGADVTFKNCRFLWKADLVLPWPMDIFRIALRMALS